MSQFRIGFLPSDSSFQFSNGVVEVLPGFAGAAKWIQENMNPDGFYYPPIEMHVINGEPQLATERAAHLFHLAASHQLTLDARFDGPGDAREVGAFVMHFVGLLHGVWLQFEDWWFDRRVPVVPRRSFRLTRDQVGQVLSCALRTWLEWAPTDRTRLANALFMHCRSPSYDWNWEGFAVDYWVTDGLWKTAAALRLVNPSGVDHAKRINVLCNHFALREDPKRVKEIVELRNGLMHEALWDGVQPGTALSPVTLEVPWNLHRLNLRLFLAILGVHAGFIATPWWCMGTWAFDLKA